MATLDTGSEGLLARTDDGVAVVPFDRPARRDALTEDHAGAARAPAVKRRPGSRGR